MTSRTALDKKDALWFYLLILLSSPVHAAEPASGAGVTRLKEVVVAADQNKTVLPDVQGAKIYSGKKTSVIDLGEAPAIMNNNFRQALEKTPGLLLSEESTPLFSVGYRGLEPHRAQFTQVLKDGIPIHADMFGYPEAYYVPALQTVDHIDFLRGGAALLYGPQPGGALNFVTKDPYDASFRFETENSFGSHDFYSNYTSVSGTNGPVGHYTYAHHRQSQGFRDFNSQFEVDYAGSKIVIEQDPTARWTVAFDLYEEEHGEPGGLTRFDFDNNESRTTRLMDHFELNRYGGSVRYEKEIDESTELDLKAYGVYYERLSWRQRGGGFGTPASGANASTNDIESQEFYTGGFDGRWKREYSAWGQEGHVFTGGVLYHHTTSPRTDERGTAADATEGVLRKDADRAMDYLSLFFENLFKFGRLSVTPGVRFENVWQSVDENLNLDKTTVPLASESEFDFVPLFGVGAQYEVTPEIDLYGNVSQSYRPKIFAQAVPNGTNQVVNADLNEGDSWQAEIGLRGRPTAFFSWDASVFHMAFEDQIGTAFVGGFSSVQNVGDAEHEGVELAAELGLIGLSDAIFGEDRVSRLGELGVFGNVMLLDAEFTGGPNTGKTPQYAADYIVKAGVEYRFEDRAKIRMAGTFTDEHFANDTNTAQFFVPSYKVWDLTAEFRVYEDLVSVFGGVNNLFDQHYFSRVRGDGIDPADGRNYYAGVKFTW